MLVYILASLQCETCMYTGEFSFLNCYNQRGEVQWYQLVKHVAKPCAHVAFKTRFTTHMYEILFKTTTFCFVCICQISICS